MGKISFKFRQWWGELLSFLRLRRFEGIITNASAEDIAKDMAKSNFKSPEEALEFLKTEGQKSREQCEFLQEREKILKFSQIKVGMLWYEDDTFSFERVAGKKIKAIVELIEDGVVYGDLTASELHNIQEQKLDCYDAKQYFEKFSYPSKVNEKIVWYSVDQLVKVYRTYEYVRKTFKKIGKQFREGWFWSSTEYNANRAWLVGFNSDYRWGEGKNTGLYVRPVLSLDTRCMV